MECRYDPSFIGHGIFAFNTAEGTLVYSGRDDRSVLLGQDVSVSTFCGGSATFSRGGRSGFLLSDLTVIDPAWERCLDFIGDYGFVRIDGLWYPAVEKDQDVIAGQLLGTLGDFCGHVLREVRAARDGHVLYVNTSLAMPAGGFLVAVADAASEV